MNGESGDIAPANAAAAGLAPRGAAIMWIVLATGIALSALAWGIITSRLQHDAQLQFMTTTRSVTETLEARIQSYEDLLLGLQGLFLSSDTI